MKKLALKSDCMTLSRMLIALLFVVAGVGKAMNFAAFSNALSSGPFNFIPSDILALVVIFIEIVVALCYAFGFKFVKAGWVLIGFTVLTVIFYHNPWAGEMFNQNQMTQALKNIAIIGGLLATIGCYCGGSQCKVCEVK